MSLRNELITAGLVRPVGDARRVGRLGSRLLGRLGLDEAGIAAAARNVREGRHAKKLIAAPTAFE